MDRLSQERRDYRGSSLGPNHWAIDLFGDETVQLVKVPGHTDGQAATLLRNGKRFALLAADGDFSPRNWQEGIMPGFGFSRYWQQKSLSWLAKTAADPGCAAVLCSRDPAWQGKMIEFRSSCCVTAEPAFRPPRQGRPFLLQLATKLFPRRNQIITNVNFFEVKSRKTRKKFCFSRIKIWKNPKAYAILAMR